MQISEPCQESIKATNTKVPSFGEFVPRLGILQVFGEKSRELRNLGIF